MSSKMKAAVAKAGDEIVEELADAAVAITKEAIVAGKAIAVEAVKDGKEIAVAGMEELKEEIKEHFNNEPEGAEEGVAPANVSVGLAEVTVMPHLVIKQLPNVSISPALVTLGAEAPAAAPAPVEPVVVPAPVEPVVVPVLVSLPTEGTVPEEPSKPDF
jgi:hypothetical protein